MAGLDQGETVTIPSLEDRFEWDAYDAARRAMAGKLSKTKPAARCKPVSERAGHDL